MTPLKTAIPNNRRALARSPSATGSLDPMLNIALTAFVSFALLLLMLSQRVRFYPGRSHALSSN